MRIAGHPPKKAESACDRCPWHYQDRCIHPKGQEGDCPAVRPKAQSIRPSL
jgi:hypothetical protein